MKFDLNTLIMDDSFLFNMTENKIEKHLAGQHDQSSHGKWASGKGSSGLSARETYNLQKGNPDTLKSKIYSAEGKFIPQIQRDLPEPVAPRRTNFATAEEYAKAYREYSDAFDKWVFDSVSNVVSDSGNKNLDGTKAGVQKYIKSVTGEDWFIQEFGEGGVFKNPKVSVRGNLSSAARYDSGIKTRQNAFGGKDDVGAISEFIIHKSFTKSEPTIIHEIAHYATTISQTTPFSAHGVEFARNHIFIAGELVGAEYATGLENAYREEGIDLG